MQRRIPRTVRRWAVRLWRWTYRFGRDVVDEWSKDRVGGLAAEIAFFALLGFFPAVIVLAAALGSADSILGAGAAADIENWLVDQLTSILGGSSVEQTVRELFAGSNSGALSVGAALAVYAASRGFTAVVRALDIAYDHEVQRGWLSTRVTGLGLTVLTVVAAAIVLTLIVIGPLFGEGAELAERLGVDGWFEVLWTWFRWPVVFLALIGWAASVYHFAPNHRAPWKYEIPGAILASVWWAAVSLGFGTYLRLASSGANAVFGLLGGALSLLFWLYLMAMGLLLGAEVNSIIAGRRGVILEAVPRQRLDRRLKNAIGR